MPNTITIRKAFSSGDDAAAARDRLTSAGFAREDSAVDQVDQHFEVCVHTAPEHPQRFRDAINSSELTVQAARYVRLVREHAPPAAQSLLLLASSRQRWAPSPDRLADTRHEEARWRADQRFTHQRSADRYRSTPATGGL